jgi:hypothetical protein
MQDAWVDFERVVEGEYILVEQLDRAHLVLVLVAQIEKPTFWIVSVFFKDKS